MKIRISPLLCLIIFISCEINEKEKSEINGYYPSSINSLINIKLTELKDSLQVDWLFNNRQSVMIKQNDSTFITKDSVIYRFSEIDGELRFGRVNSSAYGIKLSNPTEIIVERNKMVAMRDGIQLATDIYRPQKNKGRLPVILIRLPYNKNNYIDAIVYARLFAENDFIALVQDVRGKGESEGEFLIMGDINDSYDAIEWASNQEWSNGKVGTFGCSYLGDNQIMVSALKHPAHKAMIPSAAGSAVGQLNGNIGYFGIFEGGAFNLSIATGWFLFGANGSKINGEKTATKNLDLAEINNTLPIVSIPKKYNFPITDFEDVLKHELTDPWWDQFGYITDNNTFNTPALHINSWYDFGVKETIDLFNLMKKNSISDEALNNQYLIISSGNHCSTGWLGDSSKIGELEVSNLSKNYNEIYLNWFNYWLRDNRDTKLEMPKVNYFVNGLNQWRESEVWPPVETKLTKYFLESQGNANTRNGNGRLSLILPENAAPWDEYTYDPMHPVPSRGGALCCTGNPEDQPGSFDQSAIELRDDVLVFSTDILSNDLEIGGNIKVHLNVSSSAKDTDFTVKLIDVYPDGKSLNIQEGILRARYREGFDKQVFMENDGIYQLEIDLHASAYLFKKGHMIRLDISSSNFPTFDRNLNTGGDNYNESKGVIAVNRIYHDSKNPSYIELPVFHLGN